ncbi:hypothetical protein [Desulfofundulus sp.]
MSREDKTTREAERKTDTARRPALESTGTCPVENDASDTCAECVKADDDL